VVEVRKLLIDMQRAAMVDQHNFVDEGPRERQCSKAARIFVLWRFGMARYRGNWDVMHGLAKVWRLTNAKDVETFRIIVNQACEGLRMKRGELGTPWDSALSRKP
jgi:hypothetical protein